MPFGFRGKIFVAIFGVAAAAPAARRDAAVAVPARSDLPAHRAVPDVGSAPRGRRALGPRARHRARGDRGRGRPARQDAPGARDAHRRRWHRRRRLDGERRSAGRRSRTTRPGRRSLQARAGRRRHLAPPQPDDPDRHALRRGARGPSADARRPAGAAAHRGAAAGGLGPAHHAGRAGRLAGGRAGARLARVDRCSAGASGRSRPRPGASRRAISPSGFATTSATNWGPWPGCSTTPCASWRAERRELAQDRARTDAILAGMVEGVMVVNTEGRVQTRQPAPRATMLGARRRRASAALPRGDSASRRRGAADGGASRRSPDAPGALSGPDAGPSPGRPGRRRSRRAAVSGAVLVLHDITDLRRADRSGAISSPTSRTSCGRRSPRSAATSRRCPMNPPGPRTAPGSSKSSRATSAAWSGWSRTCSGWPASTRGRSPSSRPLCAVQTLIAGAVADLAPQIERAAPAMSRSTSTRRWRPSAPTRQAPGRAAEPGRERRQLLARRPPHPASRRVPTARAWP